MFVQRKGPSAAGSWGVPAALTRHQQHVSSEGSCPRRLFTAPGAQEPLAGPQCLRYRQREATCLQVMLSLGSETLGREKQR